MSRHVRITGPARADAMAIAKWIAKDQENLPAALKWMDDLDARYEALADVPGTGTDHSDLRLGMRSSPFGNYLIFFKRTRAGVQIIRVIHGARDFTRLFN